MIASWGEFEKLATDWVNQGGSSPELPSTPEAFIALGYEKWLTVQTASGRRRTLETFDNLLRALYGGDTIPSLYRKLKGLIRPRQAELERLLTTLFMPDGDHQLRASDRDASERLSRELTQRLFNRSSKLVEDRSSAWLFASQGRLVLGPDDHTRDDTFRDVMANRLNAMQDEPERADESAIPLTVWAMDASGLEGSPQAAYETRRELMILASALMAAMAKKLPPPRETPSLEFSAEKAVSLAPNIRIALRSEKAHDSDFDLRQNLLRSSVVCLLGLPSPPGDGEFNTRGDSKFTLEGDFDGNFFSRALMPTAFVNEENLDESVADKETISRILHLLSQRQICLGTKIDLECVRAISRCASGGLQQVDDVQRLTTAMESLGHYIFWYDDKQSEDKKTSVCEQFLQRIVTPPAIRTAIFLLLVAASTRLGEEYDRREFVQGTIGREMTNLLVDHQVRILTVKEFLNFTKWFNFPDTRVGGAHQTRHKE